MPAFKLSFYLLIVLRMNIYRTSWGSLKMKIVASLNLWVKRSLKLNTLGGRERRSDWLWQVCGHQAALNTPQLPQHPAALLSRRVGLGGRRSRHQNRGAVQEEQRAVLRNRAREAEIQTKLWQNQRAWEGGSKHGAIHVRGAKRGLLLCLFFTVAGSVATFISRAEEWCKDIQ